MRMNKKGIIKLGIVSFIILVILITIMLSFFSSANTSASYQIGEETKIELKDCKNWCTIKLTSPSKTTIEKINKDFFLLKFKEKGKYKLDVKSKKGLQIFEFEITEEKQEEMQTSLNTSNLSKFENNSVNSYLINESMSENLTQNYKIKGQIQINEPVKWEKSGNNSLNENLSEEYITQSPKAKEENIGELKKEVVVYSETNLSYENVLAYAYVEEIVKIEEKDNIKIYWEENNTYIPFNAIDNNSNGYIDQVKWIVPDLIAKQTFLILITKAQHLDYNKTFISDIYEQVKSLDSIWSETIFNGDYVRITFENNLTSINDITIFPRIISGNPIIEIYEKDKNELIAKFENITSNQNSQVFLTNLVGQQDTFDLKIIKGEMQFDYIVDPNIYLRAGTTTYTSGTPRVLTFTNAMPNAEYSVLFSGQQDTDAVFSIQYDGKTSSGFRVNRVNDDGGSNESAGIEWAALSWGEYTFGDLMIKCNNGSGASTFINNFASSFPNADYAVVAYTPWDSDSPKVSYTSKSSGSWASGIDDDGDAAEVVSYIDWCAVSYGTSTVGEVTIKAGYNTTSGATSKVISLGSSFSNTNYVVLTTASMSTSNPCEIEISGKTTTTFSITAEDDDTTNNCNGREFNWIAISTGESSVELNSPTYNLQGVNSTTAGNSVLFSILADDDTALNSNGAYIFSTNNTGNWQNDSAILFSSTPSWANVTKILNSTGGLIIGYRWYFNDSAGNTNSTQVYNLLTVDKTSPIFFYIPPNASLFYGNESLNVNFDATDETGFDSYSVNDSRFLIDSGGVLTNSVSLAAGNYEINITINDTSNNINWTIYNLQIKPSMDSCAVYFNANSPIVYPETFSVYTNCTSDYLLYLNQTIISNNSIINSGASAYNISVQRTDSENYTNIFHQQQFIINKNPENCQILFNENFPLSYKDSFLVWTNCTTSFILLREGFPISNNSEQKLSAGFYNFSMIRDDFFNYSLYYNETQIEINDPFFPLIDFGINTPNNNSKFARDWISVEASVIEDNEKNITFSLYNIEGLVNSSTYTDSRREINWTGLSEGTYYYNITVFDLYNNQNSTLTRKIILNLTLPNLNFIYPTESNGISISRTWIYANVSSFNVNEEMNITFELHNSGGLVNSSTYTDSRREINWTSLPENNYYYNVTLFDNLDGLISTLTRLITLDRTPPDINVISPENDTPISYSSQNMVSEITDNLGLSNFTLFIYNNTHLIEEIGQFVSGTNILTEVPYTFEYEGTFQWNYETFDLSGNFFNTSNYTLFYDLTYPQIDYLSSTPEDGSNLSRDWIYVDVLVEETNEKNITFNLYYTNGTLFNSSTYTDARREINWTNLQPGDYIFNATIFDIGLNKNSTSSRKVGLDYSYPLIEFTYPTENNNTDIERDWIYANVSVIEENEVNITFNLYNSTGIVNSSTYTDARREINWTLLQQLNSTYWYDVNIFDKSSNLNSTETRFIKLTDISPPNLILIEPKNKTYYYNTSLSLQFTAEDLHLEICWYTLNNGANITLPDCNSTTFDALEGSNTLYLYSNDSLGNLALNSVTFISNESLLQKRRGILAYGENIRSIQVPKYRFWNGTGFEGELLANSIGGTIEWIRVKNSPSREEYMLVTADSSDDINIQINSTLNNGTSCWHNGSNCGRVLEVTTGSTTINRLKADVAYETTGEDAIIVWSDNDAIPSYRVWNGSYWSPVQAIPQTLLTTGVTSYVKMVSNPHSEEIALIMTNTTLLNILIWNGTAWGCEPSSIISGTLTPDVYQHADLAYEQNSGDLFIVKSVNGITSIDYITKLNGSCSYEIVREDSPTYESEIISINSKYESDYIGVSILDITNNQRTQGLIWNGNSFSATSNLDTSGYTESSPNMPVSFSWAGVSDTGVLIYSDAATSLELDYFNYSIFENTWKDNSGTGYNAAGLTSFTDEEQNIFSYSFIEENKTLILVQDDADDLWAKIYNADIGLWLQPDRGVALETNVSNLNSMPAFNFEFRYDKSGPSMRLVSPSEYYINTDEIWLNLSIQEKAIFCNYNLDNLSLVYMSSSNEKDFSSFISLLNEGLHNLLFTCEDKWENQRTLQTSFMIDTGPPLIDFIYPTENNNTDIERDWIYANVSVIEGNEVNITFNLYYLNGTLINSSVFFDKTREINWTNLGAGNYSYNVTVSDSAGWSNTSEIRMLKLSMIPPAINLNYPANYSNFLDYNISQFTYTVEDNSSITNCSLYGNFTGIWHLNQTVNFPEKTTENNFSSIITSGDGYYIWNVLCSDIYGNFAYSPLNFTFSTFLSPDSPDISLINISQTKNDGTGEVFLIWNASDHSDYYKIYSTNNLSKEFTVLSQTKSTNYTDIHANDSQRKFYKISSWNPAGENFSNITFGKTVYSLERKPSTNTKNWIGFYLTNDLTKANDSLNEISNVTAFTMWNETIQKRVICNKFSCPDFPSCTDTNCNFDLESARGYEVNMNISSSVKTNWSTVGMFIKPSSINLIKNSTSSGKNWISVYGNTSLTNANNLIISIQYADVVTSWNSQQQTSEGYIFTSSPFPWIPPYLGINFFIEPEKAYEISVNQSVLYTQT
jgi:hypothetical protein